MQPQTKTRELDAQLASKRQELRILDLAIAERKAYHRDQEALIAETVESGNTALMCLTHDIAVAKQQLRDLKTDVRTAAQDKVLLHEDLTNIREEIRLSVTVVHSGFVAFG